MDKSYAAINRQGDVLTHDYGQAPEAKSEPPIEKFGVQSA